MEEGNVSNNRGSIKSSPWLPDTSKNPFTLRDDDEDDGIIGVSL